jgi:hypothetical protein
MLRHTQHVRVDGLSKRKEDHPRINTTGHELQTVYSQTANWKKPILTTIAMEAKPYPYAAQRAIHVLVHDRKKIVRGEHLQSHLVLFV